MLKRSVASLLRNKKLLACGAVCAVAFATAQQHGVAYAETKNIKQQPKVKSTLSKEQIEFFVREGYIIIPGLYSKEECEEISRHIEQLIIQSGFKTEEVRVIKQACEESAVARKYMYDHPKLKNALAGLVGAHLPFWDGGVKAVFTKLFNVPPGMPGESWHQDERYLPSRDRSATTVWIPLQDTTVEMGCLYIVPRSHQPGILYHERELDNSQKEFEYNDEIYGFDESTAFPVELKAGDALIFNGYLAHRSSKNKSNKYRKAVVGTYMTNSSWYPYSKLVNGKSIPVYDTDYRGVHTVTGEDPYAYKGYEKTHYHFSVLENGKVVRKTPTPGPKQ